MRDGRVIHGVVKAEDDVALHVEQTDGKYLMLDRGQVRTVKELGRASPRDVAATLSPDDIENVVAYLAAAQGARSEPGGQSHAGARAALCAHRQRQGRAAELADLLGRFPQPSFQRIVPDQHRQCRASAGALGGADAGRKCHGIHAPGGGRGDVCHRLARRCRGVRCPQRPADLALSPQAGHQESLSDQSVQQGRGGAGRARLLRHARQQPDRAGCPYRPRIVGEAHRRHHERLHHHRCAAGAEGQDHRRHVGGRDGGARLSRRL